MKTNTKKKQNNPLNKVNKENLKFAIKTLQNMAAYAEDEHVRVTAAKYLLDYGERNH